MEILERFTTGKYGSVSVIKEVKCTDLICVGCGSVIVYWHRISWAGIEVSNSI